MKKINFTLAFAAVAAMLCFNACSKHETPGGGGGQEETVKLVTPVLTPSTTSVTLSQASAQTTALTLSWTTAVPEGKAVDLTYKVYANNANKDLYSSPEIISVGTAASYAFTHKTLNDLAVKLGITAGGSGSLNFAIYAVATDHTIEPVISSAKAVAVTTYSEQFEGPEFLYLAGSAVGGWDLSKAAKVQRIASNVYEITGVEVRLSPDDQGFKFYFKNDGTDPREIAQDPGSTTFGKAKIFDGDAASLFQPGRNGYTGAIYTIHLDMNSFMMTMSKTGDLPTEVDLSKYANLYMKGDCLPWTWGTPTTLLSKTSDKVYEAKSITMNFNEGDPQHLCGFKIFLANDSWSPYFAMTDDATKGNLKIQQVDNGDVPIFNPGKIGYESGVYDVKADFNTKVLTLTKTGGQTRVLNILGDAVGGWDFASQPKLSETSTNVFTGSVTFDLSDTYKGFKMFLNNQWTPEYGMIYGSTKGNITFAEKQDPIQESLKNPNHDNDCQFYLYDLGYTSGTYTVTVNLNNYTLTLTQ